MGPQQRLGMLANQLHASDFASGNTEQGARLKQLVAIRTKLDVAIEELLSSEKQPDNPAGGMVLRPLQTSDLPSLSALNANVFAKPYPDRVQAWLASIPPASWDGLGAFAPDGQLASSFWYVRAVVRLFVPGLNNLH